jgi:nicotinamidase-related amidase
MADETLDPRRTALVFFDMLKRYDYGADQKTLLPQAREQVVACRRLMAAAREAGVPVFYANGDHRPDGRDLATAIADNDYGRTGERRGPEPGSQDVIDELKPQPGDYVIRKHRWSMFFQTELELSLRARDIDTILLAGGSTEVGVASSAYSARDLDFNTILVTECLRSGRGQYITDFFVHRVAGGIARIRSLDQAIGLLRPGGIPSATTTVRSQDAPGEPANPTSGPAAPATDPPLDPRETALVFFDTLKGGNYDRSTRALRPEHREFMASCVRVTEAARRTGLPIFYAQAAHREDGADWASAITDRIARPRAENFGRSRIHPSSHHGSWEAEIVDELAPQPGDYRVYKHRYSAFHGTHLELSLRTAGVRNVLLAGSATQAGIASTAYAGRDRDFNMVLLRDAIRSGDDEIQEYFMTHVFPRLGRVRTVDQTLALLRVAA